MKISDNLSEQEIEVLLENFYQYFETGYIFEDFLKEYLLKIGLDEVEDIPLDKINKIVDNLIIGAYAAAISKKSEDSIRQDIADEFEIYLSENVNIGGLCLRYGGNELYEHADELIKILNRIKEVK